MPILQLAFSSPSLSEAKIRDLVQNNIRLPLSALPGLAMPTPMGGKQRQITLDLGITYDQRNALVVGLAMGFAVIPNVNIADFIRAADLDAPLIVACYHGNSSQSTAASS